MQENYRSPIDINFKLPKIPKKAFQAAIAVLAAVALLYGSIYQVSPEEMGVILRFGKFVRTTEPGLHFKLPLGIESLTRVPVQRQLKLEFGFRTTKPGIQSEYMNNAGTL
jgi:membrane protease subunit HflK